MIQPSDTATARRRILKIFNRQTRSDSSIHRPVNTTSEKCPNPDDRMTRKSVHEIVSFQSAPTRVTQSWVRSVADDVTAYCASIKVKEM